MSTFTSTVETPIGPFTIVVDEQGSVLAAGWTAGVPALVALIHPRLRQEPAYRRDLGLASQAASAYHAGDLGAPASVAVRQHSDGEFLPVAWQTLREVRSGTPVSYAELAVRAGNPAAVRAAGQACARNAAALFVPCHRVTRTDGSLGGFRWGLPVKRWLLAHETGNGKP